MTHSIGEIEWDETDPTHIVGRMVVVHEAVVQVRYELHIYAPDADSAPTAWCELHCAFGDTEFGSCQISFREESIESAKAALARQVELGWR